jgi:mitogen-activated protein kinase kinase kinase 3
MCAIKEVKVIADDSNSKECLRQLNQEMLLLNQLSHPNIVQYYGSELSTETLSVYLEFVSGGSVHKLLQEYGPFGEAVLRNYSAQILSGLAYLHGRKTVHRYWAVMKVHYIE